MAVAYDAGTESHTGTSGDSSHASFTWNHTGGSSARAAVVFVFSIASTDNGSSVTYGGTSMSAVSGGSASDTAGEPGTVKAYFLDNVATGTQAVVVNRTNNSTVMYAIAITVTASGATETHGVVLKQEDQSPAQASVDDGSPGTNSLRVAAGYYGSAGPPTAGAQSTLVQNIDLTSFGCSAVRETTAGQGARNIGFTNGTSDDYAAVHFAIREAAGAVSVTPGTASLTTSLKVPTVSAPRLVTPGTASLATTKFTPTVSAPRLVTPGKASLATTRFAPTVTAPQSAVPGTASLVTTKFAPTVSTPRVVTPGTASLATSRFAPSVSAPQLAVPGTASLVTTKFAPTVSTPRLATPGKADLTVTPFAPSVAAPRLSAPGVVSLALTAFTPSVSVGAGGGGPIIYDFAYIQWLG